MQPGQQRQSSPNTVRVATFLFDCCALLSAIVFIIGRIVTPTVELYVVKAAPLFFMGVGGSIARVIAACLVKKPAAFFCTTLTAIGFAMFGLGDSLIDIEGAGSTDSQIGTTVVGAISGALFMAGNIILLVSRIIASLVVHQKATCRITSNNKLHVIIAAITTITTIAMVFFWITPTNPFVYVYVVVEIMCLWVTVFWSQPEFAKFAVIGMVFFVAADVLLFALSYGSVSIRAPLGNITVLSIYWMSCNLLVIYHRRITDGTIPIPTTPDVIVSF